MTRPELVKMMNELISMSLRIENGEYRLGRHGSTASNFMRAVDLSIQDLKELFEFYPKEEITIEIEELREASWPELEEKINRDIEEVLND